MQEKLNYPVKYAILEMTEPVNWIKSGNYKTVAYVVSKVYVTKEIIEYSSNGQSMKFYQVVFPFKDKDNLNINGEVPSYNFYGECLNEIKVDRLFDTFEEAKDIAFNLNEELRAKSIVIIFSNKNWKEKYEQDKKEFDIRLAEYEQFEKKLIFLQDQMQVTEEPVLINHSLSR